MNIQELADDELTVLIQDIINKCVDIGAVNTGKGILDALENLTDPNILGVIGTVKSNQLSIWGPDLVLSVHGINSENRLNANGMLFDILGEGPDYTFKHPVNVVSASFTHIEVFGPGEISFRGVWIKDSELRKKIIATHTYKEGKYTFRIAGGAMGCLIE